MVGRAHLALAAAVLLAATGTALAPGPAARTFRDPAGDVRGGRGPDLTALTVSHARSSVTFRVTFAKAPPLGASTAGRWVDMLLIAIDAPPSTLRRTPAGWYGADFFLGTHGRERAGVLLKLPAGKPGPGRVVARPRVLVTGRTLAITVSRARLGSPPWLELAVAAGREGANGGEDFAPDKGAFRYAFTP